MVLNFFPKIRIENIILHGATTKKKQHSSLKVREKKTK